MADYTGSVTVKWVVNLGGKVISLTKITATNYNQTGIPLTGRQAGMDVIEMVIGTLQGDPADAQAPISYAYDPTNLVLHCYNGAGQEVNTDTNISSIVGDIFLLVIGM